MGQGGAYCTTVLIALQEVAVETTSVRLPSRLVDALDAAAARQGVNRSTIVRKALEEHLGRASVVERKGLAALVEGLVTYSGSGVGDLGARGEEYLRERFRGRRRRPR